MSEYTTSYAIRYATPSLSQQIEVAVIHCVADIQNEEASAPDHANRLAWANWANKNSQVAYEPFRWAVAMNPSIGSAIEADPSGASVPDGDVQFVVNSNLGFVIADFIANPPQ